MRKSMQDSLKETVQGLIDIGVSTKYSSKQISEQNHAAIFKCSGALAITFATDFVDQLNGCA